MAGAAVLHMALAAAVSGGDSAGSSRVPAQLTPAASMQVRTIAQTPLAAPDPVAMSSDESQPPSAVGATNPATTLPPGKRYFDMSEVDDPAMPLPEWNVDVPMLMGLGVRSVSIDVLISETGVAQQCVVTRIEPQQPSSLQVTVASRLCDTVLRPAQRRGVAVASVRHIELVLAAD